MLLALREGPLKGKGIHSIRGKGSAAQFILPRPQKHYVEHSAGCGHILPGKKLCQLCILALQGKWKSDYGSAVIPGRLTCHTDTALRRQRRKHRIDHHGLLGIQLNDAVLHMGNKTIIFRTSVNQKICQYVSL